MKFISRSTATILLCWAASHNCNCWRLRLESWKTLGNWIEETKKDGWKRILLVWIRSGSDGKIWGNFIETWNAWNYSFSANLRVEFVEVAREWLRKNHFCSDDKLKFDFLLETFLIVIHIEFCGQTADSIKEKFQIKGMQRNSMSHYSIPH